MSEPTTQETTKKATTPKARLPKTEAVIRRKAKAAKEAKPKKEKAPDVCVFAFRLSEADRDRIHAAAGGGKASSFVLAATMAAVEGDAEAFKKVVTSRATTK